MIKAAIIVGIVAAFAIAIAVIAVLSFLFVLGYLEAKLQHARDPGMRDDSADRTRVALNPQHHLALGIGNEVLDDPVC